MSSVEVLGSFPSCSLKISVCFIHVLSSVLPWERFRCSPRGLGILHSTGCYSLPFVWACSQIFLILFQWWKAALDADMWINPPASFPSVATQNRTLPSLRQPDCSIIILYGGKGGMNLLVWQLWFVWGFSLEVVCSYVYHMTCCFVSEFFGEVAC